VQAEEDMNAAMIRMIEKDEVLEEERELQEEAAAFAAAAHPLSPPSKPQRPAPARRDEENNLEDEDPESGDVEWLRSLVLRLTLLSASAGQSCG
jgi:hypothetical protein